MRTLRRLIPAVAALVVAAADFAFGGAPAQANPVSPPPPASIVGLAPVTAQFLCDKYSADYNATSPAQPFYCWGATGPAMVETKDDPNCLTPLPDGALADIAALAAHVRTSNNQDNCTDIAFSEVLPPVGTSGLTQIAFAKDLVTYSYVSGGDAVANLTTAELTAIYECNASLISASFPDGPVTWNEVGGANTDAIVPVLPQSASGTRAVWLAALGVAYPGACVVNGTYASSKIEENEGTGPIFVSASGKDVVFPFSGADYVCYVYTASCPDLHGALVLGTVNGRAPLTSAHILNIAGGAAFPPGFVHSMFAVGYSVRCRLKCSMRKALSWAEQFSDDFWAVSLVIQSALPGAFMRALSYELLCVP